MNKVSSDNTGDKPVTGNIFEGFSDNEAIKQEVLKTEMNNKKDLYYYLGFLTNILKTLIIIVILLYIIVAGYIYYQNQEKGWNFGFLNPICSLIQGEADKDLPGCMGVKDSKKVAENEIITIKNEQAKTVATLLGPINETENFLFSRNVNFLLDIKDDKLQAIEILQAFDKIKSDFTTMDAKQIQCMNITINSEKILEANCSAYSSFWEDSIPEVVKGVKTTNDIGGTSISLASSFINFFENNSESPFKVIDKQKVFNSETIEEDGFSKKTDFTIRLQYTNTQYLAY